MSKKSCPGVEESSTQDEAAALACLQQAYLLTNRELDVLRLLIAGLPNKLIASYLGITRETTNKHVASILHKMMAPSRTAAAVRAVRQIIYQRGIGTNHRTWRDYSSDQL